MLTQLGLTAANDHRDPKKLNLCGKGIFIITTEMSDFSFSVVILKDQPKNHDHRDY